MLDPQAKALLTLIKERGLPATNEMTPQEARNAYRERRTFTQPAPPEVAGTRDLLVPGPAGSVPVREYRPIGVSPEDVLAALVYYHGGGWVIGDLDTHDVLCRELCNESGCAVLAVDYRMGPEHRFPAAIDDCLAVTEWVFANAGQLLIDPRRISVGGDSAGGNIASVICLALRDAKGPQPAFQLLIYPCTEMHAALPSHRENEQGYLLTADVIAYFREHYVDRQYWADWRVSPLLADDHSRLPAALVVTAGYDPLRDEGLAYADKLSAAGVPTQYVCFNRQIHGFITMGRVIDEANTAVRLCADILKRRLTL